MTSQLNVFYETAKMKIVTVKLSGHDKIFSTAAKSSQNIEIILKIRPLLTKKMYLCRKIMAK